MMHCSGRNKLAVNVWQSGKNPEFGLIVCECVSLSVCVFVPLLGVCVGGEVGGYQLLYIHGERLGGAVLPWPSGAGSGGSRSGLICRCVLIRAVEVERSWQGGWFLLEKDALSFLHPWVVLHQLRVQEGILWDAVLYPFYQALWGDRDIFQIPAEVYYNNLSSFPLFLFSIQGKKAREKLSNQKPEVTYYIYFCICSFYLKCKVLFSLRP